LAGCIHGVCCDCYDGDYYESCHGF
jgi:hypothetical protein